MKQAVYRGVKLNIPQRYHIHNLLERFRTNVYEREEVTLINKYIKDNDYVLDLGGCLGFTSVLMAKKCQHVVCVEANPELHEALIKTKADNGCDNITIINNIIDPSDEPVKFFSYQLIVAGSKDRQDNGEKWAKTKKEHLVDTIKFQDLPEYENINTIIMDIEGGELAFIKNHKDILEKQIKLVIVELHQHLMKDPNFNKKCIDLLKGYGFTVKERIGYSYVFTKN